MTFQPTLTATPALVIIDLEAGQKTGITKVEYSKESDHRIWHRWKPGAWLKTFIQVSAPDDPALNHGYLNSPPLEPGTIYQVAIWESHIDPNALPPSDKPIRALADIVVFALKKRPEQRQFFSDENQTTGGTYRQHQVVTTKPVVACMMVSTAAPQADAEGYLTFPHVEGMSWAGLNQSFFLQVQDLLPGTPYFELFRMSDAFGNWEFLKRDFTTLKRRLRVELGNLHISDDSDDLSNGEASFDFYVETGNIAQPKSWIRRGNLSYGNSNLETGKDATPAPSGSIVVGPEPVKLESRHVRFSVEGEEDDSDSFPLDDNDVGTASKDLLTPSGPDEVVSHRPDSISASGGDGWSFTLSYKYWIEYF